MRCGTYKLTTILLAWHVMFTYPTGRFPCEVQALVKAGPFETKEICEDRIRWAKAKIGKDLKSFDCQEIRGGKPAWRSTITYPAGCGFDPITSVGPFSSKENCVGFLGWAKINVSDKFDNPELDPCQRAEEHDDYERPETP